MHIRYFTGYVYHICLQDTVQSTRSLCLIYQAVLLPMPLRFLLLTLQSSLTVVRLPMVGPRLTSPWHLGLVHNLLMDFSTFESSKMEVVETFFLDIVIT